MSATFRVIEHVIPCQHIREYPRAAAFSQEEVFHLAVKQYIPIDNPTPQPGDITIIGSAANGFPKVLFWIKNFRNATTNFLQELYEPLWQDIHARSKANGFQIRSIWIADRANSGASGVLNEAKLGNDRKYPRYRGTPIHKSNLPIPASWLDHARDLLHLTNVFRASMPLPIIGIGHSMGATELANLALMHPRLFTTVVFLDPVVQAYTPVNKSGGLPEPGGTPGRLSAFRRDLWPSVDDAVAAFKKQKYYQSWDPRVLKLWLEYGVRETPTALYPHEKGSATLTTTKHHEVFNYLRPWYDEDHPDVGPRDRAAFPDMDPHLEANTPFYRPELRATFLRLRNLRPGCLYVFGAKSEMSPPDMQKEKLETTGVDAGGSGGVEAGRVHGVSLEGIGHLVAMEATKECADAMAEWVGKEMGVWRKGQRDFEAWKKKDLALKQTISEEMKRRLGGPPQRPAKGSLKGKL